MGNNSDIRLESVSTFPMTRPVESKPQPATYQTEEIKFQSFSKSQLLKKTFSSVISNEKFLSTLVKVAKLAVFLFIALITGWKSTDVGKAMVIKCMRETLKIYENVSSIIFVRNAKLSDNILQRSYNLPSVGDVLKSQDLDAAKSFASTLTTKISGLQDSERQQLGLSVETINIPPKSLESGIHTGICTGTTLALLSKVQQESATNPINAENLTTWVADQQGTEIGKRPKGWVSDAAANQAVYSYLLDNVTVNSDLICLGGPAESQFQPRTARYIDDASVHLMQKGSAILPENLSKEIRPGFGDFLMQTAKTYVSQKWAASFDRKPVPTPDTFVRGYESSDLNKEEQTALKTVLTNMDNLQRAMNDYNNGQGTWEDCVQRYVKDPEIQQLFINDKSILNEFEKTFSTGNATTDDTIIRTRKIASIIPKKLPETTRPPFNCPIELLNTHVEAFMRQKERQPTATPESYLSAITDISESDRTSLTIMLTSVTQLKDALIHKKENNELTLRDCIEKYVEDKLMVELFTNFDSVIEDFTLRKTIAIGRGADYQVVEGFELGMGLISGSDQTYLTGMKERLEPGSYELTFMSGKGGHSTALIVSENKEVFWHDSNIGLIHCDPENPELTILAALQTYNAPEHAGSGEPGQMFHAIEIVKYVSKQPPPIHV